MMKTDPGPPVNAVGARRRHRSRLVPGRPLRARRGRRPI